jgi:hypothetical protein
VTGSGRGLCLRGPYLTDAPYSQVLSPRRYGSHRPNKTPGPRQASSGDALQAGKPSSNEPQPRARVSSGLAGWAPAPKPLARRLWRRKACGRPKSDEDDRGSCDHHPQTPTPPPITQNLAGLQHQLRRGCRLTSGGQSSRAGVARVARVQAGACASTARVQLRRRRSCGRAWACSGAIRGVTSGNSPPSPA